VNKRNLQTKYTVILDVAGCARKLMMGYMVRYLKVPIFKINY